MTARRPCACRMRRLAVTRPLCVVLAFASTSMALADRMPYTIEDVQNATMIGVWCADDIHDEGGSLRIEAPWKTLTGGMTWPPGIFYNPRIGQAARSIHNGPCLILLVEHRVFPARPEIRVQAQEYLDLTSDGGRLPFTDANLKMVEDTIRLWRLIHEEWAGLSRAERWRVADVVLIGTIVREPIFECPENLWAESRSVCKGGGGLPDRPTVIVPDRASSAGEHLFFLARNPGTGPRYVVLGAEPPPLDCPPPSP